MADLFWPGDERAGALLTDTALLDAMVAVEQAWLDALGAAWVAARGGATSTDTRSMADGAGQPDRVVLAGLVDPSDVEGLATAAEAGGNPVLGLVALLRERSGDPWVHRGLTSQDVVDTALILCLRDLAATVEAELEAQVAALAALAARHRGTVMAGRTLAQHAVPVTFGLKAAGWLTGVLDARDVVRALRWPVQLGGAAGTLAAVTALAPAPRPESVGVSLAGSPEREQIPTVSAGELAVDTARRLGLEARPPWHTSRRPITAIGDALVACTDAWARIAGDVITLSRTEIGELAEPAGDGRGGSSTMPHKRNPILSVLIRRAAITAPPLASTLHLAAALSGDERPDGAWHAEWAPTRDLGRRTAVAAAQATELLAGLEVDADRMAATVAAHRDDLLAEQAAITAFAGTDPTADPSYLGATDMLIDEILARARPVAAHDQPDQESR